MAEHLPMVFSFHAHIMVWQRGCLRGKRPLPRQNSSLLFKRRPRHALVTNEPGHIYAELRSPIMTNAYPATFKNRRVLVDELSGD
ncbi:MAG: hypothetical protein M5U34_43035 [Chloroflexi bacterium]|nr:hypothetical protein [Chloroflexota bacterium]